MVKKSGGSSVGKNNTIDLEIAAGGAAGEESGGAQETPPEITGDAEVDRELDFIGAVALAQNVSRAFPTTEDSYLLVRRLERDHRRAMRDRRGGPTAWLSRWATRVAAALQRSRTVSRIMGVIAIVLPVVVMVLATTNSPSVAATAAAAGASACMVVLVAFRVRSSEKALFIREGGSEFDLLRYDRIHRDLQKKSDQRLTVLYRYVQNSRVDDDHTTLASVVLAQQAVDRTSAELSRVAGRRADAAAVVAANDLRRMRDHECHAATREHRSSRVHLWLGLALVPVSWLSVASDAGNHWSAIITASIVSIGVAVAMATGLRARRIERLDRSRCALRDVARDDGNCENEGARGENVVEFRRFSAEAANPAS